MSPSHREARSAEDERAFTEPSADPAIQPDLVSPAVEGYFRLPPVWIGEAPEASTVRKLHPRVHHADAVRAKLKCGIGARVQRDGLFVFDFSAWPLAPLVVIPGYRRPNPAASFTIPASHQHAQERAERNAVVRAQVMNVHQACLCTAEKLASNIGTQIGLPVTASSAHKAISLEHPPGYNVTGEDPHAISQCMINNALGIPAPPEIPRRTVAVDAVRLSLELLDEILLRSDVKLIQLVEGVYLAACRARDHCFGEALLLAWGGCEQLLFSWWRRFIAEQDEAAMPQKRKDKLQGRDFTSSMVIEALALAGRLPQELYRELEAGRRARNKWVHELKAPSPSQAYRCVRTAERMLKRVEGVPLSLTFVRTTGAPMWPVWFWEPERSGGA